MSNQIDYALEKGILGFCEPIVCATFPKKEKICCGCTRNAMFTKTDKELIIFFHDGLCYRIDITPNEDSLIKYRLISTILDALRRDINEGTAHPYWDDDWNRLLVRSSDAQSVLSNDYLARRSKIMGDK